MTLQNERTNRPILESMNDTFYGIPRFRPLFVNHGAYAKHAFFREISEDIIKRFWSRLFLFAILPRDAPIFLHHRQRHWDVCLQCNHRFRVSSLGEVFSPRISSWLLIKLLILLTNADSGSLHRYLSISFVTTSITNIAALCMLADLTTASSMVEGNSASVLKSKLIKPK